MGIRNGKKTTTKNIARIGKHSELLKITNDPLTYAKEQGLDPEVFMKSVATGAAGSKQLDTFGPKILKDDYAPGFFMKHFIKDMKLALIEANRKGLSLDVLSMVLANYEELEQEGYGDLGTQALMKFYDEEHRNTEE